MQQDFRELKDQYRELERYRTELNALQAFQQTPEWETFKAFLTRQAHNGIQFIGYAGAENPLHIAMKNELLRWYQDGMLKALTLADEEMSRVMKRREALEKDMATLKNRGGQ